MSKFVNIITGQKADELPSVIGATMNAMNDFDLCAKHGWRVYEKQEVPEGTVATATRIVDVDGRTAREEVVATITTAEALAAHEKAAADAQAARDKAIADFDKWEKDSRNWNRRERVILAMAKPKEMSAEDWQARFDEEWNKLNA
jgi:hypothetical protein